MKRIFRQISSTLLCSLMILSLLATKAAALEADTPKSQIGDHFEADDDMGELSEMPRLAGDTSKSYADNRVRTNKTISPGDDENEFLITLDVRTKTEIQNIELSQDAAVVLVIDLSGSMKEDNKLEKAKQAALAFTEKFAATDNENTLRKIAVVGFSGQQEISGGWGSPRQKGIVAATTYQSWTDASDASIRSAIEGMDAEGGTCLQAGLILASNLLNSSEVANIVSKNIVVLTDGCPTYCLADDAAEDTSDQAIGAPQTIQGTGSSTDHSTHTKTENTAKAVLATGIHVYGIFLGNDSVNCNGRSCNLRKTGADWLRENCGFITYAVENAGDLSNIFENISELIQLRAKAWIAEDPMGEMFDFAGFVKAPEDENEYFYNTADKKIVWNLRLSTPYDTTEDGSSVYQLTYKVRLNTLDLGYTANQYYPTNGVTSVTWLIEKSTESGVSEIENGTAYFNVPSVKGYAADVSFRKTDGNGRPLAGAEFGLYHEETLIAAASSDSDGTVLFENVPSGHVYTIHEISAPKGFVASTEKYNIEVAYGNPIGTIGEDNTVINVPERKYGGLTVSKTISGAGANPDDEFAFTVTLSDTGITGAYGDLEFTDGVARFMLKGGESATASELPAGTGYTVTENEVEGYISNINGENGSTAAGTIPADDIAFAAFHNFYEGGRIDPNPEYGGFILSKTISGDGAVQTDEFAFTVSLNNAEINGNYGDIDFINGVAAFTLKGGESVTASELPAGTGYIVTENNSKGYAVTVNGESTNSVTGMIEADNFAEIVFNNYKAGEPTPPAVGIDITKTVQATGDIIPDWENIFGFVVSRNLPDTASEAEIVATPLIAITGTGTDSVGYEFDDLEFTENGTATYYVWEMPQDALFWNYDMTLYRVTVTRNLETGQVDREYARITGFGDEAGFEPVADISFVNVYHHEDEPIIGTNGGDLIISKTVSRGDRTRAFTFTVTLDDPEVNGKYGDIVFTDGIAVLQLKDGESATAEELPAGIGYTVRESDNDGYTVTVNGTGNAIAEGKIVENETAVAAFLNDKMPDTGSVKVTKTVTGNKAPAESIPYSFRAWVRDSDGNAISESVSYIIAKVDGSAESGTAVISADGYVFSLKNGESITFNQITEDRRFEVQEITAGDFTTAVSGLSDGVCTIQPNVTKKVEFINDYDNDTPVPHIETGSVKVTKVVTGNKAPAVSVPYSFRAWVRDSSGNAVSESVSYTIAKAGGTTENGTTVIGRDGCVFSLKGGESFIFTGITEGRRFEVKEITTGDFTTTVNGLSDGSCTILPNVTKEVEFVNDYGDEMIPPNSNRVRSVPQTGDASHLGLWIAILCLSLLGMLVTIFAGKRRITRWK